MKVSAITEKAKGDIAVEIVMLEKQVEMNSNDVEIYLQLSTLYRKQGDYKQAWASLQQAEYMLNPPNNG